MVHTQPSRGQRQKLRSAHRGTCKARPARRRHGPTPWLPRAAAHTSGPPRPRPARPAPQASSVDVYFASNSTDVATVLPSRIRWISANWTLPGRVNVTGARKSYVDGTRSTVVVTRISSADAGYKALALSNISVTVNDDDAVSTRARREQAARGGGGTHARTRKQAAARNQPEARHGHAPARWTCRGRPVQPAGGQTSQQTGLALAAEASLSCWCRKGPPALGSRSRLPSSRT